MSKAATGPPQEKIDLYERLIASHSDIEQKGATSLYTSHNGNMFSQLGKDGVVGLRLAMSDREAFLELHDASLFESYGAVMKEYVAVPDALLRDIVAMRPYLDTSYAYVQTLKPKPTKRTKK